MSEELIIKWVEGTLDDAERTAVETAMQQDPTLNAEMQQLREAHLLLHGMALRQKLNETYPATAISSLQKSKYHEVLKWLLLLAIGVLFSVIVYQMVSEPTKVLSKPTETPVISKPIPPDSTVKKEETRQTSIQMPKPIAKSQKPKEPASTIRGSDKQTIKYPLPLIYKKPEWYYLLTEQWTKVTNPLTNSVFEKAHQALDEIIVKNDTIEAVRSMVFIESGDPQNALRTLLQVNRSSSTLYHDIQWLIAIAFLQSERKESALQVLKTIAQTDGHPWQGAAENYLKNR